ncbi:MAG: internal scaffolding protein [Arizlama microvirus]|nr:MAG: internal scaffolding protein [Arizlama microvirus]
MNKRISGRFMYEKKSVVTINKDSKEGRSKTAQSFAKEANINTIINKYRKTGILVDPMTAQARQPFYGDFTSGADYFDNMTKLQKVKEDFARLPGKIRAKFDNNVGQMLDFVADPANVKECVELGLMPKEALPKDVPTPRDPVTGKPIPTPAPVAPPSGV